MNEKIGLFKLQEEEYRAIPALNHSSLKNLFPPKTPLDFKLAKEEPTKRTEAMDFGTAIHLAVFEPFDLEDKVVCGVDCDRRTTKGKEQYKEFCEQHAGKIILAKEQYDSINWIVDAVQSHRVLQAIFAQDTQSEVTGLFSWDGIPCKFKADCVVRNQNLLLDLKTTQAGHERAFIHSILDYHYHTQAEFYLTGMEFCTMDLWNDFLWIAVETKRPHHIYLWEPEKTWLNSARETIETALNLFRKCEQENNWPGVPQIKRALVAPTWMGVKQ